MKCGGNAPRLTYQDVFALTNFDVDPELYTKPMLMLGGAAVTCRTGAIILWETSAGSTPASRLSGCGSITNRGTEIACIRDWDERINEIARLTGMGHWFYRRHSSWLQLMIERIIEYHQLDNIHQI